MMMTRVVLAVLLCCFAVSVSAAAVQSLTPDTFDTVVDGSKGVFVEFFAPWVSECTASISSHCLD